MSFIRALDLEIDALHATLAANPDFVKWNELRKIRELYGSGRANRTMFAEAGAFASEGTSPHVATVGRGRRADPARSRAVVEAEELIRAAEGEPVPTSKLYELLLVRGVVISGEKPLNNLSATLSNSGLFTANGRRGWTMRGTDGVAGVPEESVEAEAPREAHVPDPLYDTEEEEADPLA